MSTPQIINLLIHERNRLDSAIHALGGTATAAATHTGRAPRTPEQRQKQSEKMKAFWAAKKRESAPAKSTRRKK